MQYDIHSHRFKADQKAIYNRIYSHLESFKTNSFSIGIHPWYIPENINWKTFNGFLSHPDCVALGECGLDRICSTPLDLQEEVFKEQIVLAEKYQLPLIIHCVRAFQELISLKKTAQSTVPWIIHGFEKTSVLQQLLDNGFYISLGAAICNNRASMLRSVVTTIPLNRIFLETDDQSTYSIADIYNAFSSLRSESSEEIEYEIEKNIKRIFAKWKIG